MKSTYHISVADKEKYLRSVDATMNQSSDENWDIWDDYRSDQEVR